MLLAADWGTGQVFCVDALVLPVLRVDLVADHRCSATSSAVTTCPGGARRCGSIFVFVAAVPRCVRVPHRPGPQDGPSTPPTARAAAGSPTFRQHVQADARGAPSTADELHQARRIKGQRRDHRRPSTSGSRPRPSADPAGRGCSTVERSVSDDASNTGAESAVDCRPAAVEAGRRESRPASSSRG